MTDPELLEMSGRALYSADWHRGLARALAVNDSSVRNWMHGRNAVPLSLWEDIATLLRERQFEIADTLDAIAIHAANARSALFGRLTGNG